MSAQTPAEIAASLGLPETASSDEIELAMAEAIGDEDEVLRLRAMIASSSPPDGAGELDEADQRALLVARAAADDEHRASELAAAAGFSAPPENESTPSAPARPTGRLRIPDETKGRYVVLWARKPAKGDQTRPAWVEVDCVAADRPENAKRAVLADDAPFAAFLKASAAQKPGILLRAVPAMHWPQDVKATTYTRPAPVLEVG